jgi:hypothetical protein
MFVKADTLLMNKTCRALEQPVTEAGYQVTPSVIMKATRLYYMCATVCFHFCTMVHGLFGYILNYGPCKTHDCTYKPHNQI